MRNSLTSTPIKLSCAGLALCHTIEKTWILVKTGLLFPVFATLTRNDPWARITGQNSLHIICNIFNGFTWSPSWACCSCWCCRSLVARCSRSPFHRPQPGYKRSHRTVDAFHIISSQGCFVLYGAGLAHIIHSSLPHKPTTTSTTTQNSTELISEDSCFFGTDIILFTLEVSSRLQMVKGSPFTACTYSSILTFHVKECNLNPKLELLILISHSMPFTL